MTRPRCPSHKKPVRVRSTSTRAPRLDVLARARPRSLTAAHTQVYCPTPSRSRASRPPPLASAPPASPLPPPTTHCRLRQRHNHVIKPPKDVHNPLQFLPYLPTSLPPPDPTLPSLFSSLPTHTPSRVPTPLVPPPPLRYCATLSLLPHYYPDPRSAPLRPSSLPLRATPLPP
ncbi:uncharacterized protein SCHCODRAFT_02643831 [Schizophyllum commune H4-8]|uniref:uncharacterized protein n=1 Tax=Schizophyllum commune (strain H4-8 / FGSC 9210) TaxID=578458 RepID=UPI00215E2EA5|nr:uncharacterized protein SCHCODRAFT_02643831 [Schizophyllum commune H4-8]KAI5885579.1 hypothetical protein SCHCODRAFT_02643831 [Schizophyllum commune H4-8]